MSVWIAGGSQALPRSDAENARIRGSVERRKSVSMDENTWFWNFDEEEYNRVVGDWGEWEHQFEVKVFDEEEE